ncbi:M48 family metallopeptidase [Fodinisporobacter ferrooxydans]|uniref:M48 family metallopeptidase n=1 Tax=Fodinisporobacter ferrooxydans TaxID=2901836 RepID=A0ABY4CNX1_9BACL|nr:M48 family metallopeptidase [Alicyclobacillaceae bacterium MYW30-H2]
MQIIISGIPVEICKKNIKNMHLYVKPPSGKVSVSAPLDMSDEAIERFVRTKSSWIKEQVNKFEAQPRQTEREYVSGETLYVWGKQYFLQVEYGTSKNSLFLSGDKAILTVRRDSTTKQRDSFVKEWYRDLLKREVARLLPKWEKITGIKCDGWQTKYMTTRWGTCNTDKRKLWFNLQLAKKTPECLEYIILHELLHLVERNHNANFLSLMDKYMPYWRETKRKLNGQILDFME